MIINRFKIYWSLVLKHPLYFINAYIAAIFTNYLLTLQPGFLKVFINEATKGSLKEHLLVITYFMIGALLLAFIFDTIQVSTSMLFKINIEKKLRLIHFKYAKNRSLKDITFPIQRGIFGLTEFLPSYIIRFFNFYNKHCHCLVFYFLIQPYYWWHCGVSRISSSNCHFPNNKAPRENIKRKGKIKNKVYRRVREFKYFNLRKIFK